MSSALVGLLAETAIHPGAGRSLGVVDLPVAREAATDYPVIVGSGLKGALRDKARQVDLGNSSNGNGIDSVFGKQDRAGSLLVSDGRLLLLPVRSLQGAYRWLTCPLLLERFGRDRRRAGLDSADPSAAVEAGTVLGEADSPVVLEERTFDVAGPLPDGLVDQLGPLLRHEQTRERLAGQVLICHDDDFAWFARFGLAVQARNVLAEDTKQSTNLWYEETLPCDTVMYSVALGRGKGDIEVFDRLFPDDDPYLQVGGNETVGQGWLAVRVQHGRGERS